MAQVGLRLSFDVQLADPIASGKESEWGLLMEEKDVHALEMDAHAVEVRPRPPRAQKHSASYHSARRYPSKNRRM